MGARSLVVTRTAAPAGLRVTGEIDESNVDELRHALAAHRHVPGRLHVDLTELDFCDVGGIRALVRYAEDLDATSRLVLHGLPAGLEKVMLLVGWAEGSRLDFCGCADGA